jgi:DNA processing protein
MKNLTREQILLTLNASDKIGPKTFKVLAQAFNDDFEIFYSYSESKLSTILPDKILKKFIEARKNFSFESQLRKLDQSQGQYLTIYDERYPKLLRQIYDPPFIIYYLGEIENLSRKSISIVGSRKYTHYGQSVAYKFAHDLAESGLCIISGLALGIDAIVHKAAVSAEGTTIGVLACGIDQIYPESNRQLAEQILKTSGTIISEQSPGSRPLKQNFPSRNRIISGLSLGTLVIEAAESSGSLITAAAAIEQNREVFAIPGNIDSKNSVGTNNLIKLGARPVTAVSDILEIFNLEARKPTLKNYNYNEWERLIIQTLEKGALHIDKICQTSKLDIALISENLTLLELKGVIRHLGGGNYQLNIF